MANSPKYIDNPESFRPERWLRTQKDQSVHPFVLLPFGHGPRMCIGRRFAEQEISIFIAKIIQKFKIEWHHEDMKMKTETLVRYNILLYAAKSLTLKNFLAQCAARWFNNKGISGIALVEKYFA